MSQLRKQSMYNNIFIIYSVLKCFDLISCNSSDEHTPVEEDVKNSSSDSSSQGKSFINISLTHNLLSHSMFTEYETVVVE